MNLTEVLHPVSTETFFEEYWNRKPLLIRRDAPSYYKQLLPMESPESLLLRGRLRHPEARLVKQSKPAPHEVLASAGLTSDSTTSQVKLGPIRKAYAEGYTLVIRAEMCSPVVAGLCRALALELRFPFFAELFCTPQGSQGSNLHHDPFDAFIMQLSGTKHWKVYGPSGCESPHAGVQTTVDQVGPLLLDEVLEPGDLLYFPRPFPHVALTSDGSASTHLSLAARPYRWSDLLQEAVDQALKSDASLHESVPYDYLEQHSFDQSIELQRRVGGIVQALDAGSVRDRLGLEFMSRLAPLDGDFLIEPCSPIELTVDTRFRLAPGVGFFIAKTSENLQVAFPGEQLALPLSCEATLQAVSRQVSNEFSARSLQSNLNTEGRLVLLRHLLRVGAICMVREGS